MQPGYGPPPAGERWNVNMPAVIGVVFVFLIGVIVWVVASSTGDADGQTASSSTTVVDDAPSPTTVSNATTEPTLSPTPLPSTVPPTEPTTSTSAPTTTTTSTTTTTPASTTTAAPAPATTAPGAGSGAVPGDLAISGHPMLRPPCDGGFITVLASAIGGQATSVGIEAVLDRYSGSNYLRTDQACSSLNQTSSGEPIYVVFYGPFVDDSDACSARTDGPEGAYARQLSNDVGPDHFVECA